MSQHSTPRLLLRRCDEFNSTVSKGLVRLKNVWHGKRDSHKATNKLFTLWIRRIYALESELTFTGGQLGPTKLIVSIGNRYSHGIRIKAERALPISDEDPDRKEFVLHVASGNCTRRLTSAVNGAAIGLRRAQPNILLNPLHYVVCCFDSIPKHSWLPSRSFISKSRMP